MDDRPLTVAVQGELGSNSELAAREYFDGRPIGILPCRTFADLFAAVGEGRGDAGMAPVENSLAGSIHDVWDLFVERSVPVRGEIQLRVSHCLIAHPGTRLEDIRRIRSHPQALAQCREFLDALEGVVVESVYDTAGAVKMLKEEGLRQEAAIASAQAAVDHRMEILIQDLQSRRDNYTRFLVLGQGRDEGGGPLRTTVILELEQNAAALPAMLGALTRRGIEVLKVETRKRVGRPWAYGVYLEVAGDAANAGPVAAALAEIATLAGALHLVGTYPSGAIAEPRLHTR